jgi:hypothetical protein
VQSLTAIVVLTAAGILRAAAAIVVVAMMVMTMLGVGLSHVGSDGAEETSGKPAQCGAPGGSHSHGSSYAIEIHADLHSSEDRIVLSYPQARDGQRTFSRTRRE